MTTLIHGCDVAPGKKKGIRIFDGRSFRQYKVDEFDKYTADATPRLITWDAPLTGPIDPDGANVFEGDLTYRPIERFFQQEFRPPKGISVQPYGSCCHWTISRYYLGLPRVGRFCSIDGRPFTPLFEQRQRPEELKSTRFIVEVHPAVALWLWCRHSFPGIDWRYKGKIEAETTDEGGKRRNLSALEKRERVREHWNRIRKCVSGTNNLPAPEQDSDDALDALIAWMLGDRWMKDEGVVLVGNAQAGSILVPTVDNIVEKFESFWNKWQIQLSRRIKRT